MTLRCYDVHDQIAYAAVVFARDEGHAIWIARLDYRSSADRASPMTTAIERKPGPNGLAAEHLMAAIAAGKPGIGHLQEDGSWLVLPSGVRPLSSVRPERTELTAFTDEDGDSMVFFARDAFRAGDLYDAVHDRFDRMPKGWVTHAWETWTTVGLVRHGVQAQQRGVEGVGVYHPDRGWQILALDYAAIGVAPPDD